MKSLIVKSLNKDKRLDVFVFESLKELGYKIPSRSFLKEYMNNFVLVNSRTQKPSYHVRSEDIVEISDEKLEELLENTNLSEKIIPQNGNLDIRFETDDYIVVNKPKGISMHPGVGNTQNTLANYIKGYLESKGQYDKKLIRAGIVHRLDKGVSGLVVIAKNRNMQDLLSRQFERHEVDKVYLAQVEGECTSVDFSRFFKGDKDLGQEIENLKKKDFVLDDTWYRISGYIGRSNSNRLKMKFSEKMFGNAKESISYLKPISSNKILVKIETGRMHQIRATLEYLGFTIIGDTLYNGRKSFEMPKEMRLESIALSFRDRNDNKVTISL